MSLFKNLVYKVLTLAIGIIGFVVIGEIALRILPIPGINFSSGVFNPDTHLFTFIPNHKHIEWNIRGERIERMANQYGYLDIEHTKQKPKGVYRIGFFGDSYVEAKQVSLENTFFRIIEKNLRPYNVECIAFGMSRWGTLHSYINSEKWVDYFDIDLIVYVFVENDIGDNFKEITDPVNLPYVILNGDSLVIGYPAIQKFDFWMSKDILHKSVRFVYGNSYLLQNIVRRLRLLKKHGIKTRVYDEDIKMASSAIEKKIPNQEDLPSTWPIVWKNRALKASETLINQWKDHIKAKSKDYSILYVPRSGEWQKSNELQDSWKLWLMDFCKEQEIYFIDPTESFLKAFKNGKVVYDDHFSVDGHIAFAEAFSKWWLEKNKKL